MGPDTDIPYIPIKKYRTIQKHKINTYYIHIYIYTCILCILICIIYLQYKYIYIIMYIYIICKRNASLTQPTKTNAMAWCPSDIARRKPKIRSWVNEWCPTTSHYQEGTPFRWRSSMWLFTMVYGFFGRDNS